MSGRDIRFFVSITRVRSRTLVLFAAHGVFHSSTRVFPLKRVLIRITSSTIQLSNFNRFPRRKIVETVDPVCLRVSRCDAVENASGTYRALATGRALSGFATSSPPSVRLSCGHDDRHGTDRGQFAFIAVGVWPVFPPGERVCDVFTHSLRRSFGRDHVRRPFMYVNPQVCYADETGNVVFSRPLNR